MPPLKDRLITIGTRYNLRNAILTDKRKNQMPHAMIGGRAIEYKNHKWIYTDTGEQVEIISDTAAFQRTLTIPRLRSYPNKSIFASGIVQDNTPLFNFTGRDQLLRWIAVKGNMEDWAIYIGKQQQSEYEIKQHGDKLHREINIKHLMPCTDAVFELYRY